jgi:general stress protein 26
METPKDPKPATPEDVAQIWKLMEKVRTAFLVSLSALGPHARPMSPIVRDEERLVWFLTDRVTVKDDEIGADERVAMIFTDGGSTHLAVTGTAELVDDRATVKDLWSTAAQAFWPEGPDDPRIVAIRVQPTVAELWDGPSAPVAMVQMAAALVTGRSAADMGHNVRAEMG